MKIKFYFNNFPYRPHNSMHFLISKIVEKSLINFYSQYFKNMHRSEYSKRLKALDDRNISFIISQNCKLSRNIGRGSYKCKGNCADLFATVSDAFKAVRKIRQSIWIDSGSLSFDFSMQLSIRNVVIKNVISKI